MENSKGRGDTKNLRETEPIPLKNVTLAIGTITAKTDADGNFILRELPGGPLLLTLVPQTAVADSVKLPSWPITLPHEPFKAEGVNITISNPELLQYLVPEDSLQSLNAPKAGPVKKQVMPIAKAVAPIAKPKLEAEKPKQSAIGQSPMPIARADSANISQAPAQIQGENPDSNQAPEHLVVPSVNRDHLIDCVQTVGRNRNGHRVLVCSDVITTR